ncbi:MAG: hypothetical protein ACI4EH_14195 [Oliverpabstia sp.]
MYLTIKQQVKRLSRDDYIDELTVNREVTMKRKVLLIVSCMMLSTISSAIVKANVSDNSETVRPMAQDCINCGTMSVRTTTAYEPWSSFLIDCEKKSGYTDMLKKRNIITTYTCSNCRFSHSVITTEQKIVCNH